MKGESAERPKTQDEPRPSSHFLRGSPLVRFYIRVHLGVIVFGCQLGVRMSKNVGVNATASYPGARLEIVRNRVLPLWNEIVSDGGINLVGIAIPFLAVLREAPSTCAGCKYGCFVHNAGDPGRAMLSCYLNMHHDTPLCLGSAREEKVQSRVRTESESPAGSVKCGDEAGALYRSWSPSP